jgi:peptidoglycan-N-acetylmuramic acid deacetylase
VTGITGKTEILPGETANFVFNISAPSEKGSYEIGMKLAIQDFFEFTASEPLIWGIDITTKVVALTFDDGYGDIDAFIDVLNEEGVKGTFFMLGYVAQANPEEMKRIVEEGHLLASHSVDHADFRTLGADSILWELNTTRDIMKEATGYDVYPYFRYPYGAHNSGNDAVLKDAGWKYFQWTNGTGDWKFHENTSYGRDYVYKYATLNPPDQAVVLMHVISQSTLAALPDIIDWYRDNGYTFVTVDELE